MKKIKLHSKKYVGLFALVDDEDYDYINQYRWSPDKTPYGFKAKSFINGEKVYMHRLIMNPPKGMVVDHINFEGLDNRRSQLRICTYSQNTINTKKVKGKSKYKGVRFVNDVFRRKPWCATIWLNGKPKHLGYFEKEQEAALAYNKEAKKIHGEFAYENRI